MDGKCLVFRQSGALKRKLQGKSTVNKEEQLLQDDAARSQIVKVINFVL